MPPNWPTYAWYTAAAILGLLGAFLLIKWLIGDRSKGRRRCPKCWYDMSATTGLTCPECGRTARAERRLFRTRRRARLIVLAAVACSLAWCAHLTVRASRYGWLSVIPTTILIVLVDNPYDAIATPPLTLRSGVSIVMPVTMAEELAHRYLEGPLWRWQWRILAMKAAEIPDSIDNAVTMRPRQLDTEPMCACIDPAFAPHVWKNSRLSNHIDRRLVARPRFPGAEQLSTRIKGDGNGGFTVGIIGSPPPGMTSIDFDLALVEFAEWSERPLVLRRGRASATFSRETDPLTHFNILKGAEVDAAIADSTRISVVQMLNQFNESETSIVYEAHLTAKMLADVDSDIITVLVEVLDHGTVIASGTGFRSPNTPLRVGWYAGTAASNAIDHQRPWRDPKMDRWSFRISGVIPGGHDCSCSIRNAWQGSFTRPMAECSVVIPPADDRLDADSGGLLLKTIHDEFRSP